MGMENKKEEEKSIEVIFRKMKNNQYGKGGIIALFPYQVENNKGHVLSYEHQGQHSSANYNHIVQNSRLATPEEYQNLKRELTNDVGYKLLVVKKRDFARYDRAYTDLLFKATDGIK
jgi:hypothetical protein